VAVADNPTQGSILVDGQGRTLYLFEQDNGTTSACTGSCAQVWPALAAAKPTAGTGADAAMLGTANGQVAQQVTYSGHLLYTYSGDAAPGDVKGVSIPGWYPVNPSGAKVDKDDDRGKNLGY
jgi:predicted lipoprotein with Yx(FWY)xxD motif